MLILVQQSIGGSLFCNTLNHNQCLHICKLFKNFTNTLLSLHLGSNVIKTGCKVSRRSTGSSQATYRLRHLKPVSKKRLAKSAIYGILRNILKGIHSCASYFLVTRLGLGINSEFLCHKHLCKIYSSK